jgi:hypothetical protein
MTPHLVATPFVVGAVLVGAAQDARGRARVGGRSCGAFSREQPTVTPVEAPDRYLVRTSDGRAYDETDAVGALRLVVAELPN